MIEDRSDEVRDWYSKSEPDGAQRLDGIKEFLSLFVVYPGDHELNAHVLWIGHCWFMNHWESTPRISRLSPEPGSGKSCALEVTEPLVPRPVHAVKHHPGVSVPQGERSGRAAHHPVRRDRHCVRAESQRA